MGKRIIFCSDGTWDTAQSATNVYKLFKSILTLEDQLAFYDEGVGSDGTSFDKLVGGAFGNGLFQNIKDGYGKIAEVYEPGDDIFLFGFSRGAYTSRSLAGMIAICGLPTKSFDDNLVQTAFQAYRHPRQRASILASLKNYWLSHSLIKMVGVWDTVGSLGIPALFGKVGPLIYGFLDTNLHPNVLNAYHALAIDERRGEFPPTLWTQPFPPIPGQVLEQVWFSGVHCNVGGGYEESGLSDITLGWMLEKAGNLGLQIDPDILAKYSSLDESHALDKMHESWNLLWLFPQTRTIPGDAAVSNTVAIRCESEQSYQPKNLQLINGKLDASYQVVQVVNTTTADLSPAPVL